MLQGSDLLTPNLAGEPFVDRPPLVYALAAVTGKLASGILTAPDAARLAAGLLLGLTLYLLALTGNELFGRNFRWMPVLLFVGCVGLWDRAHQLSPELGLLDGDRRRAIRLCARAAPAGLGRHRAGARRRVGVPVARIPGPVVARSHCRCAPARVRDMAHAALHDHGGGRARRRGAALRVMADRAGGQRPGRSRRVVERAVVDRLLRPAVRKSGGGPGRPHQESALVCVARAPARRVDAVDARPWLQRRPRRPGRRSSGHARARHAGVRRGHGRSEGDVSDADPAAACAARRAGDRHAEARASRAPSTGSAS